MTSLLRLLNKVGLSGFFVLLITMVFAAWLFPQGGVKGSWYPMPWLATYGPALIFFFYGLKLSPNDLKNGLSNWPVHVAIQVTTFVAFPVVLLVAKTLFGAFGDSQLWIGAFYLAALPSTVSSSVVMVSIAGGDVALAVLNASLSSLLGIVLTPLWMSVFLSSASGTSFDLAPTIMALSVQVLLPVIAGAIMHRWWGSWANKNKKLLKMSDQFIILMIVYTAFCGSFGAHQFDGFTVPTLVLLGALMLGFFLAMFVVLDRLARAFGLGRPQRITLLFCGSKKSLVQGASMSPVLFPGAGGIVLLPLMLYHALQLMAGSIIAQQMARKTEQGDPAKP